MVKCSLVAWRYARAYAQIIGQKKESLDETLPFFIAIGELFAVPPAKEVLISKIMPASLKKELIDYALSTVNRPVPMQIQGFLRLVLESSRIDLLGEIVLALQEIADEEKNLKRGLLVAATKLNSDEIDAITKDLERGLKANLLLEVRHEPQLLGGFVAKIGNTVIDLSLKKTLESLVSQANE